MSYKLVMLVLFASTAYGDVMIMNKQSGLVIDGASGADYVKVGPWQRRDSQLWTFQPSKTAGAYIYTNVATGKVLDVSLRNYRIMTWWPNNGTNQQFFIQPDERITSVKYTNRPITQKGNGLLADIDTPTDDYDKWMVVNSLQPPGIPIWEINIRKK